MNAPVPVPKISYTIFPVTAADKPVPKICCSIFPVTIHTVGDKPHNIRKLLVSLRVARDFAADISACTIYVLCGRFI